MCGMPYAFQDYIVGDRRRDHSIRVPRPDLSVKLGTPNPCNNCHQDKWAEWAAEQLKTWYGGKPLVSYTPESVTITQSEEYRYEWETLSRRVSY